MWSAWEEFLATLGASSDMRSEWGALAAPSPNMLVPPLQVSPSTEKPRHPTLQALGGTTEASASRRCTLVSPLTNYCSNTARHPILPAVVHFFIVLFRKKKTPTLLLRFVRLAISIVTTLTSRSLP